MNDNIQQTEQDTKTGQERRLTQISMTAPRPTILTSMWNNLVPSRTLVGYTGVAALAGAVSIHFFFNNEEKVISTAMQDTPFLFHAVDDNTTLIQQGSSLAVRYGSVVCPIVMGWPENTSIILGSKGDATITPTNENPLTTILGTRDVTIKHEIHPDAKDLMMDFYRHSENCMVIALQNAEGMEPSGAEPTF